MIIIYELLGEMLLASVSHMGKNTCQASGNYKTGAWLIVTLFLKGIKIECQRKLRKTFAFKQLLILSFKKIFKNL